MVFRLGGKSFFQFIHSTEKPKMKTAKNRQHIFLILTVIAFLFLWNSPAMAQFGGYKEDKNGNLVPPSSVEKLQKLEKDLLAFKEELERYKQPNDLFFGNGNIHELIWHLHGRWLCEILSLESGIKDISDRDLKSDEVQKLISEINQLLKLFPIYIGNIIDSNDYRGPLW